MSSLGVTAIDWPIPHVQGFQTSMYASAWFLTMFASVLSLNVAFRVMDIFLVEGREIIFRVGLALLDQSETKLIQLDLEDMLKVSQYLPCVRQTWVEASLVPRPRSGLGTRLG